MKAVLLSFLSLFSLVSSKSSAQSIFDRFNSGTAIVHSKYISVFDSSSREVHEKVELRTDSGFIYTRRIGLLEKVAYGRWRMIDDLLVLTNTDTSQFVNFSESFDSSIPKNRIKFLIESTYGGQYCFLLNIEREKRKKVEIDNCSGQFFIKAKRIKKIDLYFPSSYATLIPKYEGSNFFSLRVNTGKVFAVKKFKILDNRLYPVDNLYEKSSKDYYLRMY